MAPSTPSTPSTLPSIARTVEKTTQWLTELAGELGRPGDDRYALRVLRGVLHTLRDRLPVDEAADLAAQLPELLRGIYYESWRPSSTPRGYHDGRTFLDQVTRRSLLAGETEATYAVDAVARVLHRHISAGELADVVACLPSDVAALLAYPPPSE